MPNFAPSVFGKMSKARASQKVRKKSRILGFRLGARITMECMDGNDGDIREVTDYG